MIVIRHGDAQRGGPYADADRPLLQVGERQAARAGRAFRQLGMRPGSLWTSPARRCRQTGEIVAAALGMDARWVDVREELAAGVGAARILPALLQAAQGTASHPWWIVVGRQPDLEELLQQLLVGEHGLRLFLPPGGCACVEFTRPGLQPPARLRWALTPEWVELAAAGAWSASRADGAQRSLQRRPVLGRPRQGSEQRQRAAEVEELDALVLTGELPIDAYLDRGFEAWLKKRASY